MSIRAPEASVPEMGDVVDGAGRATRAGKREMAITNKAIVNSVKGAGWAAKLGGSGLSKLVRAAWRNKRDLGMIGATAAVTASAMAPEQAVDVSKSVVSGSVDAIHNPKGSVGSATSETGQALLDAADTAVAKARQGLELTGEKLDLPGTKSHDALPPQENQEKKN